MRNTIKKTLVSLLGAATLASTVAAQDSQVERKPFIQGGSISSSFESNYTGNDYGMAFGDNPVLQTYVEAKLPKGISAGLWNNYDSGLDRKHCFNEIDFVASTGLPIDKLGIPKDYRASITGVHLTFPHTGFHTATTATLSLSKKDSPISLNLYKVWGKDSQQGYAAKLAYDGSQKLTENTQLKYQAAVLANSHAFTKATDLSVFMGKVSLNHDFSKKTSGNIGIRHQIPINTFNGFFSKRTTLNVGLSHTF